MRTLSPGLVVSAVVVAVADCAAEARAFESWLFPLHAFESFTSCLGFYDNSWSCFDASEGTETGDFVGLRASTLLWSVLEEVDIINCSQFVFCLMSYVSGLFVELSASRRKSCRYSRKCNQFTLLYKLLLGSFSDGFLVSRFWLGRTVSAQPGGFCPVLGSKADFWLVWGRDICLLLRPVQPRYEAACLRSHTNRLVASVIPGPISIYIPGFQSGTCPTLVLTLVNFL